MRGLFILIFAVISCGFVFAETKIESVMSFYKWKQVQVLEAQNKVVRLSNRMHLLKSRRFKLKGEESELNAQSIEKQQNQLKLAIDNLQFSKELTIDDYYVIYLSQFTSNSEALGKYIKTASTNELVKVLQIYLENQMLANSSGAQTVPQETMKYLSK